MNGGKKTKTNETVKQETKPVNDPLLSSQISNIFGQLNSAMAKPAPAAPSPTGSKAMIGDVYNKLLDTSGTSTVMPAFDVSLDELGNIKPEYAMGVGDLNYVAPEFTNEALQSAIDARIDPLAAQFTEQILPQWKSSVGGQGAFDSLRSDFDMAALTEQQLARPATQAAAELIFQANESNADRALRASEIGANFDLAKAGIDTTRGQFGANLDLEQIIQRLATDTQRTGMEADFNLSQDQFNSRLGFDALSQLPTLAAMMYDMDRQGWLDQAAAPYIGVQSGADIVSMLAPYLSGTSSTGTSTATTKESGSLLTELIKGGLGIAALAKGGK